MNVIHFGEGACEKIRRYLDSYVSNELLVETNHEVLKHLESCGNCAAELQSRTRIKSRLKTAVERQSVPPDLEARIRDRVRRSDSRHSVGREWMQRSVAIAAVLLIAVGIWTVRTRDVLPALADVQGQDVYIQRVSATISQVLRVGLTDHIHCSIFRKYPKNPPTPAEMTEKLGPAYRGLVPLVKDRVPSEYHTILAHQCGYRGRRFVHVIMTNGSNLLSLVIARKRPGETLAGLTLTAQPSGVPVYQAQAVHYEVAGFETNEFLAFVVSDLKQKQNLQIAESLAPGVHALLANTRS